MADVNASDYGQLDYGEGLYSALPVWLAEADVAIKFVGFGSFGLTYILEANVNIEFEVHSFEYMGPFWLIWIPEVPPEGTWVAEAEDGNVWIPDVVGSSIWIPVGPDMTPNEGP